MDDKRLLESYIWGLCSRDLTLKTKQGYTERIGYLIRLAVKNGTTLLDITRTEIQHHLIELRSPPRELQAISINGRIKAWRQFYGWVDDQGLAPEGWKSPMEGIPKMREATKMHRLITPSEYSAAIKTYSKRTFTGMRNRTLMLLAWDCMLRKQEMLQLRVDDVQFRPDKLLRVFGKGRKEYWLPFSAMTASKLTLYLDKRAGIPGDLLFPSKFGTPIDEHHGYRIFRNAGNKLDPQVLIHPHLVRRSSATHLWKLTGNIYLIKTILRHSSVRVTEQYVQAGQAEIVDLYEKISPVTALNL